MALGRQGYKSYRCHQSYILPGHERQRRVGAHAARIGPFVAIVGPLVILRQRHRIDTPAVDETHERELGPFEPILDHHLAVPELVVEQHVAQRGIGLLHRLRDDHTLACRQPVVFQHCRQRTRGHVVARLLIRGEGTETRRRDTVFGHQLLGELLRRLDARGRLRRAEDPQSRRTETVDDTRRQRRFGAYDRQRHVVRQCKIAQSLHLRLADRDALGLRRDGSGRLRCRGTRCA